MPPEDVRSGFTDSAFSLLDDLDLLLFSFSAESGESQEGLVLLLFLEESGKRRYCYFCFFKQNTLLRYTFWVNGYFRLVKRKPTGSILVLSAFGFLACLTVIDSMVLEGKQHDVLYVNNGNNLCG